MKNDHEPGAWAPSSATQNGMAASENPEIIHNHYYTAPLKPVPWYRKRKCLVWTSISVLVFIVVTLAVVLVVVLKLEVGRNRLAAVHSSQSDIPSPRPTHTDFLAIPTIPPVASDTATLSNIPANSSRTDSQLRDTASGKMSPFPATSSGHQPLTSPIAAPASSPSSTSSVTHISEPKTSEKSKPFSTKATTAEAESETAAAIFNLSEVSQLGSVFIKNETRNLRRRLLVWQDDKSELIVTEWAVGHKSHYRLRDRVQSHLPEAQHGTSLAMTADDSGCAHIFFLDAQGILSHVFEAAAGEWKAMKLEKDNGPIAVAGSSPLSAALHRTQEGTILLGVAYGNSVQVRLAMTDKPKKDGTWHVFDVAPLPKPAPGTTDTLCFAVAGDWKGSKLADDVEGHKMLLTALVEDGLHVWQCSIDSWPHSH